MKRLPKKL